MIPSLRRRQGPHSLATAIFVRCEAETGLTSLLLSLLTDTNSKDILRPCRRYSGSARRLISKTHISTSGAGSRPRFTRSQIPVPTVHKSAGPNRPYQGGETA